MKNLIFLLALISFRLSAASPTPAKPVIVPFVVAAIAAMSTADLAIIGIGTVGTIASFKLASDQIGSPTTPSNRPSMFSPRGPLSPRDLWIGLGAIGTVTYIVEYSKSTTTTPNIETQLSKLYLTNAQFAQLVNRLQEKLDREGLVQIPCYLKGTLRYRVIKKGVDGFVSFDPSKNLWQKILITQKGIEVFKYEASDWEEVFITSMSKAERILFFEKLNTIVDSFQTKAYTVEEFQEKVSEAIRKVKSNEWLTTEEVTLLRLAANSEAQKALQILKDFLDGKLHVEKKPDESNIQIGEYIFSIKIGSLHPIAQLLEMRNEKYLEEKYTQTKISRITGVDVTSLNKVIKGKLDNPSADFIVKIARYFKINPGEFLDVIQKWVKIKNNTQNSK